MNTAKAYLGCMLAIVIALVACAPKPRPPVPPLYERRTEPMEGFDLASIHGRRIMIDPGHGGVFRGARGVGGLDEADVNLGVALYLWGLLEEAGAEPVLTRSADRDFVHGDSTRLRDDLKARVDMVAEINPDVFMSLHHNADVAGDTTFNEIQVYYKMGDSGPSFDIARAVGRHLRKNIGEPKTRVVAGNYYVLRNSAVPAILSEPSYITNTQVESKLKLSNKQRLEAEVYFLALLDYFSRGVPQITAVGPMGTDTTGLPVISVGFDHGSIIDPPTVTIYLDGVRLKPFKIGLNRFAAFPPAYLESGTHSARASGRAIGGNASPEAKWDFTVRLTPEILTLAATPPSASPPYPQKVTAAVLDRNGNPVADSTMVTFTWHGRTFERQTVSGEAAIYLGKDVSFGEGTLIVDCESLRESLRLTVKGTGSAKTDMGAWVSGFVRDGDGNPIESATVLATQSGAVVFSDRDGYFAIGCDGKDRRVRVSKPGFKESCFDVLEDQYPIVTLDIFYHGLPAGAVVALDAAGGGGEIGWVGLSGRTAADMNLMLAKRISGFLSSVGVKTRLTREVDQEISKEERVRRCESWKSALVVSVSHGEGKEAEVLIEHYPGSRGGTQISEYLKQEIKSFIGCPTTIGETAEYVVQQTSCPAVKVTFVAPSSADYDSELGEPSDLWVRAYAVFCALIRHLGVDEGSTFSVSGRVTSDGVPCPNPLVVIDGTLETVGSRSGDFKLRLLERGNHVAEAFSKTLASDRVAFNENTESVRIDLK